MIEIDAGRNRFLDDRLPPVGSWPRFEFSTLPDLAAAERLNVAGLLLDRIRKNPWRARMAIRTERTSWSYGQLVDAVDRLAHVLLADLQVRPGDRVLLRALNGPLLVAGWLAAVRIGAIVVPTHPALRRRELTAVLLRAGVTHVLCQEIVRGELEAAVADLGLPVPVLCHGDGLEGAALEAAMERLGPTAAAAETAADAPCLILFTSGSTGQPKATVHDHRNLAAVARCFAEDILQPTGADLFCGTPSLAFAYGLVSLMLFPLSVGATMVLTPDGSSATLADSITRFRPTVCVSVPTAYRWLARECGRAELAGLTRCLSAGEPLSGALARQWNEHAGTPLIDGLGSTEMLGMVLSARPGEAPPGVIGRPVRGYRVRILDADGQDTIDGAPGRLAVRGPTGCRYLGDPDGQRAAVVDGWTQMADLVAWEGAGLIRHIARADDLILAAGHSVAGPEVEAVLASHPDVAEVGVIGLPRDGKGDLVAAFVVPAPGCLADAALAGRLQDHVRAALAPYKAPRAIHFLDELPRTATGKLDRAALRLLAPEAGG